MYQIEGKWEGQIGFKSLRVERFKGWAFEVWGLMFAGRKTFG